MDEAAVVEVADVFDGDTVRLGDGRHVRLIGINAPEIDHENPGSRANKPGNSARRALAGLIRPHQSLRLSSGHSSRDKYGRTLGYLGLPDGASLSAQLVGLGWAFAVSIDPNTRLGECLLRIERGAEEAGRGLWAAPRHWVRDINSVAKARGFAIVRARPSGLYRAKRSTWIDFGKNFSVRISSDTREKYPELDFADLRQLRDRFGEREIEARGWAFFRRGKTRMNLSSPHSLRAIGSNSEGAGNRR